MGMQESAGMRPSAKTACAKRQKESILEFYLLDGGCCKAYIYRSLPWAEVYKRGPGT